MGRQCSQAAWAACTEQPGQLALGSGAHLSDVQAKRLVEAKPADPALHAGGGVPYHRARDERVHHVLHA